MTQGNCGDVSELASLVPVQQLVVTSLGQRHFRTVSA